MLVQVTERVKHALKDKNIILPKDYYQIFTDIAFEMGVDISNVDICKNTNNLDKHRETLEESTEQAINAIENKDTEHLSKIKENMILLQKELSELKELVFKDELTQVYNRKYISKKLINESGLFVEDGIMVMLDMNNLKIVNDTIGHVAGDKAIIYLANRLKQIANQTVRYGGDEFLLFFKKENEKKVIERLNKFRDELLSKKFIFQKQNFKINFAYAKKEYSQGDDFKEILQKADEAMYKDKKEIKAKIK